jgi:GR25 family glycosyltransferase involved in LPS biosynthesis
MTMHNTSGRNSSRNIGFFYINLDKSIERRKFQENQSKIIGYPFIRVNAITPNDSEYRNFVKDKIVCNRFAIILSVIKAFEEFKKSDFDMGIILEDDAKLLPNNRSFIIEFMKTVMELPKNWEIFHLCSNCYHYRQLKITEKRFYNEWPRYKRKHNKDWIYPGDPNVMAVKKETIDNLIFVYKNELETFGFNNPIDVYQSLLYGYGKLKGYFCGSPQLCVDASTQLGGTTFK